MTKTEYTDYQASVAAFFKREGLNNLSILTKKEQREHGLPDEPSEPFFSSRPCHCCQRHLGGDRYDCHGYNPTTKEVQGEYEVCVDCVFYNEYGVLDDQTMMDMADEVWSKKVIKHENVLYEVRQWEGSFYFKETLSSGQQWENGQAYTINGINQLLIQRSKCHGHEITGDKLL